jgi:uncharacterized damage-inducible protein DinB
MLSEFQYPIGKFVWPTDETGPPEFSRDHRAAYISTIEALPEQLREAVARVKLPQLDIPYREGGWSIRQMVHHIADSHMNSYVRFKLALTEDQPTIKPYNEASWAELVDARTGQLEPSLNLIDGLHARWALLLRDMNSTDYERAFSHPELGVVKLKTILAFYDWHSRHHLAQIVQTRQRLLC